MTLGLVVLLAGVTPVGAKRPARPVAPVMTTPVRLPRPVTAAAPVRPGQLLVKTAHGSTRAATAALAAVGGRARGRQSGGWQVVEVPPGREHAAAARLAADPAVAAAEPNYLRFAASHEPDELGWGVSSMRAPQAWELTPPVTGAGVRVAVLDSGVDDRHPQLVGRVGPGYDVYDTRGRDDCGHGTAVAGVVAAAHDGSEAVGVAPDATIIPVKVLRYEEFFGSCVGDDASIAQGIIWAADPTGGRADIINLSLSGPPPSRVLADAVKYAAEQGVLVVAASGNAGDRVPNYPAAYPEVVSVGGLERTAGAPQWWPFSTFGSVDIGAPGKSVPVILASGITAQRLGFKPCPTADNQPHCADGTSFAAPHVAGLAALLRQRHPELAALPAAQRVARLRQWILATAIDIAPSRGQVGVDMKTGHGQPDALAALTASDDSGQTLLSWEVGERIVSPTTRMLATPATLRAAVVATTGTGEPLGGRDVTFSVAGGGTVSTSAAVTDSRGRAPVVFSSTDAGRRTLMTAHFEGRSLPLESYVLQRDDNIPGSRLPGSPFAGDLDVVYDIDDVYRVPLRAGETMRTELRGIDAEREYVDMYLHGADAHDVTNPEQPPLREDTTRFEVNPKRLRRTVTSDGLRYLHIFGIGTYRARWWIESPGKVTDADASPATITPDGDRRGDRTLITWRTRRSGDVTLRLRNADDRVVRSVTFGRLSRGPMAYRWDGRSSAGRVVAEGTYRATVHWTDGKGRVSATRTRVRVDR